LRFDVTGPAPFHLNLEGLTMNFRLTLITAAVAVLAAATSAVAFAQTSAPPPAPANDKTPGINAVQANEAKRINQGVASGQLTAKETRRLDREQQRIAVVKANAKADGTVTAEERTRLHKMQKAASHDIYKQKHDAQTAAPAPMKP
jgi:Spy/CpxP family protein refolding chaperone